MISWDFRHSLFVVFGMHNDEIYLLTKILRRLCSTWLNIYSFSLSLSLPVSSIFDDDYRRWKWINDVQCENDLSSPRERARERERGSKEAHSAITETDHILNWNIYWMKSKKYTKHFHAHISSIMARQVFHCNFFFVIRAYA